MPAPRSFSIALAVLALTLPLAGCLSSTQMPATGDVVTLHVEAQVDKNSVGYPVPVSSPVGQDLVDLTLEAITQAEGPVAVEPFDGPRNMTQWRERGWNVSGPDISLTFTEPQNFTWEGDGPPPLRDVRGAQVLLEAPEGTPNLFLRTADSFAFYHAPVNQTELADAAERALDTVRAEHGGELPYSGVQVTRPDGSEGNRTANGTRGNPSGS